MDALAVVLERRSRRDARHAPGRRNPHGGARARGRHDRVRDRDRLEHALGTRPAGRKRWMSDCLRSSATRTRGSSAEPCATSFSCARFSTSTSRARSHGTPRIASLAASGDRCFRSPSDTEHGASSWTGSTRRSTSPRSATGSMPTSRPRLHLQRHRRARADRRDARTPRGRADLAAGVIRAVSESIFLDDPLRLLRAVRFEDELGFVWTRGRRRCCARRRRSRRSRRGGMLPSSSGSRERIPPARRGRPARRLGGELHERLDALDDPDFRLVAVFGDNLRRLPISNELKRYAAALRRARRPRIPLRARSTGSGATPSRGRSTRSPMSVRRSSSASSRRSTRRTAAPLVRGDELGARARSRRSGGSSTSSRRSGQRGRSRRAKRRSRSRAGSLAEERA